MEFRPRFEPPPPLETSRFRLVVLGPQLAEMDYAAIMGSRARLREELQWGRAGRRWPPDDFTFAENEKDLARHERELQNREAFAYAVLDRWGTSYVGCIYIEPAPGGARLAFWVTDELVEDDTEAHLVETVLDWLHSSAWPFERIVISLRPENVRAVKSVEGLGLTACTEEEPAGHVHFESIRPG